MRPVAGLLLTIGVAIAAMWSVLLLTDGVAEVHEARLDIYFHLGAELLVAGLLVTAGIALWRSAPRAGLLAAMAIGALAYTTINSAGYYADAEEWGMVGMFATILLATVIAAGILLRAGAAATRPAEAERPTAAKRPAETAGSTSAEPRRGTP